LRFFIDFYPLIDCAVPRSLNGGQAIRASSAAARDDLIVSSAPTAQVPFSDPHGLGWMIVVRCKRWSAIYLGAADDPGVIARSHESDRRLTQWIER
jgi:hypothetical protein